MKVGLIQRLAMGAFVGCFIIMFVMVLISLQGGPKNVQFPGVFVINAFLGSIVVGWGFSQTGLIYERDDIHFRLHSRWALGC